MDQQSTTASPANGASTSHDLFALTDEQILEIEPQAEVARGAWRAKKRLATQASRQRLGRRPRG